MQQPDNPFTAPIAGDAPALLDQPDLAQYTAPQLKKLYYRSCNVSAIAGLILIGTLLVGWLALAAPVGSDIVPVSPILWAVLAFNAITFVGLVMRTEWGRLLGVISCLLMLLRIPIGTIIGILGLFAFFGARELFGPNRVTHARLKAAFKELKRQEKEQRRRR